MKKFNLFIKEDGKIRKSIGHYKGEIDNIINLRCDVKSENGVKVKPLFHFIVNNRNKLYLEVKENEIEVSVLIKKIPESKNYLDFRQFLFRKERKKFGKFKKIYDCYVE